MAQMCVGQPCTPTNVVWIEDKAVLKFFETSGGSLLAGEAAAGVRHHVVLSIVGTDRTPENGYFRAKAAQEKLVESSGIPYTIIRSTQFLEFLAASPLQPRTEMWPGFRPTCSSLSRQRTLLLLLPMWRSRRRETALSKSPDRNERRSTNSSPAT